MPFESGKFTSSDLAMNGKDDFLTMQNVRTEDLGEVTTVNEPFNECKLIILAEPQRSFRFRYRSEGGSHGMLAGENCDGPKVKIVGNNTGCCARVTASLYTTRAPRRPHVHLLKRTGCAGKGVCIQECEIEPNVFVFRGLYIEGLTREEAKKQLRQDGAYDFLSETEIQLEITRELRGIDLNCVRICFEAEYQETVDKVWKPLCKVFSREIRNCRTKMKILHITPNHGYYDGGDEVSIGYTGAGRHIVIRFFVPSYTNPSLRIWEHEAVVLNRYAGCILIRTPKFEDGDNLDKQTVYVELYLPFTGECSDPVKFQYYRDKLEKLWETEYNFDTAEVQGEYLGGIRFVRTSYEPSIWEILAQKLKDLFL